MNEIKNHITTNGTPPSFPKEEGKYTCFPCKAVLYLASLVMKAVRSIFSFFSNWLGCSKTEITPEKPTKPTQTKDIPSQSDKPEGVPPPESQKVPPAEPTQPNISPEQEQKNWLSAVGISPSMPDERFKTGVKLGYHRALTEHKKTALHMIACYGGGKKWIKSLIEEGVDPNAQEPFFGNTALLWAIANAHNHIAIEIITAMRESQLLIGGLNIKSTKGNTALHLCIGKGYTTVSAGGQDVSSNPNLEITRLLLAEGANPNLQDQEGNTPLHIAALRRDLPSIQLLLEKGANPNIKNENRQLALDLLHVGYQTAREKLDARVAVFLLDETEYKNEDKLEHCRKLLIPLVF